MVYFAGLRERIVGVEEGGGKGPLMLVLVGAFMEIIGWLVCSGRHVSVLGYG